MTLIQKSQYTESLEKIDKLIERKTKFFNWTSFLTILIFIYTIIEGLTKYGWMSLSLGIFLGLHTTILSMNLHLLISEKITLKQINDNNEELKKFILEQLSQQKI